METQARKYSTWESNRAGGLLAIICLVFFVVFGVWVFIADSGTEEGDLIPKAVAFIFIITGLGGLVLVGRDVIGQLQSPGRSFPVIDRHELPPELAAELTAMEEGHGSGSGRRGLRVHKLVRIDERTVAWSWWQRRSGSKHSRSVVAVTVSEPFQTTVRISPYLPDLLRRGESMPVDWLGNAVTVATADGTTRPLDSDRRIRPIILATVPSRSMGQLPLETRDLIPLGHEVVPIGLETVIGFANGTTVLLAVPSTNSAARRNLLATADRVSSYL